MKSDATKTPRASASEGGDIQQKINRASAKSSKLDENSSKLKFVR